ncbi:MULTISPECIES: SusC/RagA family TonB-linked outer membrane protein [Pedobacter]|uniref:TonB-dependent receptor plug n=1 Tax=Pedobacter heparinus (strain ATCC 13125 / DSM 2366 / CIP 104194 / JCM 7457 / NBRC 12017 / NCIMB 9290 / NRRL B-14731 / HIM 762-3) TaxID=485917 RepID=C6XWP1_PEDHD|nr:MULTISPECIES: TonB-dependent receptor [Pedobacter]ACU06330.1 TonB-dependent receptor plug [Pedobacter heparinus DSM 2366]MBB5437330.1 TonB-linked SusC/RagA family outer membrane protein [Pedobacter sp. AK017]
MKRKLLLLFVGISLLFTQTFAQQITVTGMVTSSGDGLPIPGASVKIKGTQIGTQTKASGTYSISAKKGDVLVFSYIGSLTQERTVSGTTLNVVLREDDKALNEIVVVGYGTQRKANLTGAVTSIDVNKTLSGRPIADVGRALQGVASGLSVVVPSGEVGSDPLIKIRGQIGSFRGTAQPLILLDNVEIPSIQLVNPADIASISVLKDAAASSIYGAKAAFGVILITTKTGSGSDKPTITYTNNFSFQNPWKDLRMGEVSALKYTVDAAERIGTFTPTGAFYYVDRASYQKAVEWQNKYGGTIGSNDPTVFGRDWYVQGPDNQKMGVRTYNPYDLMVKEWAPTQQHNLSIGGTTGKTSYNIGLAALNQSGMMKPAKSDKFTRYNGSVKVSSELNDYVTVRGGAIFSQRNKEYAYITNSTTADPWLYLYRWGPLYPFGNDENGDPIRSPASEAAAANTANILQTYFNANAGATVNITKNWKVDFDYTYSRQDTAWRRPGTRYTARNSWVAPRARVDASGQPVYVNSEGQVVSSTTPGAIRAFDLLKETYTASGSNPDHMYRFVGNWYSHTINAFTTYNLKLKEDHDFKFILGLNRVAVTNESQFTQITNLTDISNPQFNFAAGTTTGGGNLYKEAQLGYFGRVNYAFKNKYLLEANLRYDGTSKFPRDLWWRWFPSFSAGWVASEEQFMEWAKPSLSMLKVRGSWGSIGDQTVSPGLYISQMPNGLSNWISGGIRAPFVGTPTAVQSSITWQDIETKNLGLDLGFFNNSLTATVDVYQRKTKNAIVPKEGIPLTFGVTAPVGNYGELSTKGLELAVEYNHKFGNGVGINVQANYTDAKTTITKYGTLTGVNDNYVGRTIGDIWGYRTDRLFQLSDFDLDANGKPQLITLTAAESALNAGKKAYKLKPGPNGEKPVYQPFLQTSSNFYFGPGDVKFVDVNGDGEISNGKGLLADHGDQEIIGNANPRYEYGFRLGADYKGFDISAFFQGVGSRKIWGDGFLAIPGYNSSDGAMPAAFSENYWTPENTGAFYPAAYNNGASNNANNMQIQDRYLLNMAYLRLKNLTLGYSFPPALLKKISLSSLRVYAAVENLITWDKLGDLPIDPEAINGYSMWNISNYNSGRTATGVPAFKSISFGVQLNF